MSESYDAGDIKKMEFPEAIRKRPGMYIGDVNERGLHTLVFEIVDNSIDEAMSGFSKNINVQLFKDGSVLVEDDGRGIPVAEYPTEKISTLEIIMTKLYVGGSGSGYKVSGGLHGVSIKCVNAFSEWFHVVVKRDGGIFEQRYLRGVRQMDVKRIGDSNKRGTRVHFKPDPQIFPVPELKYEKLSRRLRELAALNPGLIIAIFDERSGKSEVFKYPGGIKDYVEEQNAGCATIHNEVIYCKAYDEGIEAEAAFQYTEGCGEKIFCFANNVAVCGGTHMAGFMAALRGFFNTSSMDRESVGKRITLIEDDLRNGLSAVISARLPDPVFDTNMSRLCSPEVEGFVAGMLRQKLAEIHETKPNVLAAIFKKVHAEALAREAKRRG